MITKETVYVVLEYWLTEADWDALQYEDSHSTLHQDETWGKSPEKSGPNIFVVTTRELVNKFLYTRKEAYADHVKASEEHDWADCESDCALCDTSRNEKTYSYEIKEVDLIKEECNV